MSLIFVWPASQQAAGARETFSKIVAIWIPIWVCDKGPRTFVDLADHSTAITKVFVACGFDHGKHKCCCPCYITNFERSSCQYVLNPTRDYAWRQCTRLITAYFCATDSVSQLTITYYIKKYMVPYMIFWILFSLSVISQIPDCLIPWQSCWGPISRSLSHLFLFLRQQSRTLGARRGGLYQTYPLQALWWFNPFRTMSQRYPFTSRICTYLTLMTVPCCVF